MTRMTTMPRTAYACRLAWLVSPMLVLLIGCAPKQSPARADLRATDTAGRVPALVDAADRKDVRTLGELIHALSDDDAAVRLFAIQALGQRTGQTLGYRYYDAKEKRSAAVARWRQWLTDRAGPDAPATADALPD